MIERLERYLERKNLELNVSKTKILRFKKGRGRLNKRKWRWKRNEIEEIKEFKYLGYTIQRNGGQEAHVRERVRRAAAIMEQIWGIGKRRFGKDWERRIWLFDKLIWTVIGYGVEIWGWKERENIEKLEERYLRWIIGVESRTLGYMVREELQREKIRRRADKRTWRFENRLLEGYGSDLTRKCFMEMREKGRERKLSGKEKE
ncbi:hypothetical protein X777_14664 [Ooceraea biroi]|uniref:Reverse transcriptase domain-containing protein n=1 Tax=Ooceraea biroi TaxID=2015173 RepID=A0A026WR41_OOCBI|nr:hypothetical protein X777_14664 [Ooceraea biroi]